MKQNRSVEDILALGLVYKQLNSPWTDQASLINLVLLSNCEAL